MADIAKVLRKLEYGVYVVTMGKGQEGNAFTASWLTQCSSEPPMVALAVNNKHQSTPKLKEAGAFAVNLIAEGQDGVAKTYYGPAESGYDRLKGTSVTSSPVTNSPLIPGNCGYLDCVIKETVKAGNHTVYIAEVKAAKIETDKPIMTTANSKLVYTG